MLHTRSICLLLVCLLLVGCSSDVAPETAPPDYHLSPNYGKSLAIFGGSFSRIQASEVCKAYWQQQPGISWQDFGINGAGFSNKPQDPGVQYQISQCQRRGKQYDLYLFWSPSNDFTKVGDNIGLQTDYTEADNYDPAKLGTLLGGMNYCYQQIKQVHPEAEILLFTTLPVFHLGPKGYEPNNTDGIGLAQYVDAEILWAKQHNFPYLDLFRLSGFTLDNYSQYYEPDALHPNRAGYDHLKQLTTDFLAYPQRVTLNSPL